MVCEYFIPFCRLILACRLFPLLCQKLFSLMQSTYLFLFLMSVLLVLYPEKSLQRPLSMSFSPTFSSTSFAVPGFNLVWINFCLWSKIRAQFYFLHVNSQFSQCYILKRLLFLHVCSWCPCQKLDVCIWGDFISRFSILFCLSIFMPVSVFMPVLYCFDYYSFVI